MPFEWIEKGIRGLLEVHSPSFDDKLAMVDMFDCDSILLVTPTFNLQTLSTIIVRCH